jgi:hypothetical protein
MTHTNETTKTITTTIDAPNGVLSIQTQGHMPIIVLLNDMADDVIRYATLHGFKQKIVDAAALSRNPDTGRSATVADKYNAMLTVYNQLMGGNWNKRVGDGTSTGNGGLLFRALCMLYPAKSQADIKTFLDGKTKSEQATLRKNPKVSAIIETLRDEDDNGETDTDAMLDELSND